MVANCTAWNFTDGILPAYVFRNGSLECATSDRNRPFVGLFAVSLGGNCGIPVIPQFHDVNSRDQAGVAGTGLVQRRWEQGTTNPAWCPIASVWTPWRSCSVINALPEHVPCRRECMRMSCLVGKRHSAGATYQNAVSVLIHRSQRREPDCVSQTGTAVLRQAPALRSRNCDVMSGAFGTLPLARLSI